MTNMIGEAERGDIEPTLRDVDDSDAQLRAALVYCPRYILTICSMLA